MPTVRHHGAGGLCSWLGVLVGPAASWGSWWDQPGVPAGQVCRLAASGSSGSRRERGPSQGWRQSPSFLNPSLHRQLSCQLGTLNFGASPIPSTLLGSQNTCLCQALSHPAPALHLQLIRVQAELSPWQPKQEERRLGAGQG